MPRSRRGYGEGAIYLRSDGRWCATLSLGYGASGKRRRRFVYGATKKEAQDKLAKLVSSRLDGTIDVQSRTTVAAFLNRWLEDAARPTLRATTHANYKRTIDKQIGPRIGGVHLSKLSPVHVQAMYADMERNGVSAHNRLLAHAVLHKALKQAMRWGLVTRNACDAVSPPRIPKAEIQPLTVEQVGALLSAAVGDRLHAIYVLAIGTGMRLGELFGLQWADVDLERGFVRVRHTLSELNGKLTLSEPKTEKSRRNIDLPAVGVAALHDRRKLAVTEGHASVPWVFCNVSGGPLRRSHFHRAEFKPLLKAAGIPSVRFHDLRHTSATLLLSAGVHPKVVQERLGHSQIGITLDTYSHVLPTMGIEAASKLDSALVEAAAADRRKKPRAATA